MRLVSARGYFIFDEVKVEFDSKTGLELIPLTLLRKYIIYARDHIHPKLEVDDDRISKLYSDLRKESDVSGHIYCIFDIVKFERLLIYFRKLVP